MTASNARPKKASHVLGSFPSCSNQPLNLRTLSASPDRSLSAKATMSSFALGMPSVQLPGMCSWATLLASTCLLAAVPVPSVSSCFKRCVSVLTSYPALVMSSRIGMTNNVIENRVAGFENCASAAGSSTSYKHLNQKPLTGVSSADAEVFGPLVPSLCRGRDRP